MKCMVFFSGGGIFVVIACLRGNWVSAAFWMLLGCQCGWLFAVRWAKTWLTGGSLCYANSKNACLCGY